MNRVHILLTVMVVMVGAALFTAHEDLAQGLTSITTATADATATTGVLTRTIIPRGSTEVSLGVPITAGVSTSSEMGVLPETIPPKST